MDLGIKGTQSDRVRLVARPRQGMRDCADAGGLLGRPLDGGSYQGLL